LISLNTPLTANTYRLELLDDNGQIVQWGEYVAADASGYTIRRAARELLAGVTVRAYAIKDGEQVLVKELYVEGIRTRE